jgi:hypothetical protein
MKHGINWWMAFRELCDAFPSIRFSLEYKPHRREYTIFYRPHYRCCFLLLVQDVDRPNQWSNVRPGTYVNGGRESWSIYCYGGTETKTIWHPIKRWVYTRLAAEDGLMFGSIHPIMALELMYQLRRTNVDGHFYFDTFPQH